VNTLAAMGIVDPFGALQTPAEFARAEALQTSREAADAMFVLISHLHLDKPECLDRLRTVLDTFAGAGTIPAMFILMGDFCSRPFGQHAGDRAAYQANFDALADLLASFPDVATHTQFVLVPGPGDPGATKTLPSSPLPASFCRKLLNKQLLPRLTLATNPARIRFFTQEIVVFRHELCTRLRRRAVVPPFPAETDVFEHVRCVRGVRGGRA
jgi:DNA polymerase epsilon subunit 2